MSALLVVLFLGSAGMFCIEASVLAHGVSIWWLPFFALSAATVIGIWFWQTWGLYGYFGSSLLGMMLFARFGDVVDAVRWLSVLAIAAVIIAPKWRYFRSGAPVVDDAQLNPLPARPGIVWSAMLLATLLAGYLAFTRLEHKETRDMEREINSAAKSTLDTF